MLNAVLVKEIKWLEMGWNGVVSPNLSELVRAVRTVEELSKHSHVYRIYVGSPGTTQKDAQYGKFLAARYDSGIIWDCGDKLSSEYHIFSTGRDKAHNTLQPSRAVYIWSRTA